MVVVRSRVVRVHVMVAIEIEKLDDRGRSRKEPGKVSEGSEHHTRRRVSLAIHHHPRPKNLSPNLWPH
jgi:hypothetical protein